MKIALSIPGFSNIDTGTTAPLPEGVPVGGLFDKAGNAGIGQTTISAFVILIIIVSILTSLWAIGKGGLELIQSRGIKEKTKTGRERVLYGIFGLIMLFLSFFFISVFSTFFGFDLIPFLKFK